MGNTFGSSDWVEKGQVLHFEVDANHVLTSWNTQCESVFGLRSADVVGSPLLSALSLRTEAEVCPLSGDTAVCASSDAGYTWDPPRIPDPGYTANAWRANEVASAMQSWQQAGKLCLPCLPWF